MRYAHNSRTGICRPSSGIACEGTFSCFPLHRDVTSWHRCPRSVPNTQSNISSLTDIELLVTVVTVVTVVTMLMPNGFLVSPLIYGHQFQRGDVLGLTPLFPCLTVLINPLVTDPDLNP